MNVSMSGGNKKDFGRIEDGTYMSRIVQVVTLGKHEQHSQYPEKGDCDKVLFVVDYPTEMMEIEGESKPRICSKTENMFLTERANLYKIIKAADPSWDGKDYDLSQLLGREIMTTIGSTSGGKAKITNWSPAMKGMQVPETDTELIKFDFYNPDLEVFGKLFQWVQDMIREASNFSGSKLDVELYHNDAGNAQANPSDDEPF